MFFCYYEEFRFKLVFICGMVFCFCRCCFIYDRCYDDIIVKNICDIKVVEVLYVIMYIRDGCMGCGKWCIFIFCLMFLKFD